MKSKAVELHENIPTRYYLKGIKNNPFQRFWHLQRFKNVSMLVERVNGEILDVGCADGTFTKIIVDKARPRRTIGIDVVKTLIEDTKKRFAKNKEIEFITADVSKLPFVSGRFEAVFCLEALEHMVDVSAAFKEMKRVLKKGGYLVVLVPTDTVLFTILWWIVLHTWGGHWKHTHIQSFNKQNSLVDFVRKQGLVIEKDKKFLLGMLNVVKARKI